MKKTLALFLALVMLLGTCSALAEATFKNTDKYPLEGDYKFTITSTEFQEKDWYPFFDNFAIATGIDFEMNVVAKEQVPLMMADEKSRPEFLYGRNTSTSLTIDQINEYGMAGALLNYAEYLDQMPNLKAAIERDPALLSYVVNADGSFYTLPTHVFTMSAAHPVYYMRADHIKLAGWDHVPTTIDEFVECLRDCKAYFDAIDPQYVAMTDYNGASYTWNGNSTLAFFPAFGDLLETGITTTDEGKKITVGFTTEQYKLLLKFYNTLYTEKILDQDCFSSTTDFMKPFMADGHTTVNSNMSSMTAGMFPEGNIETDLIIPEPLTSEWQSEKRVLMGDKYGWMLGLINPKSENLDAILAYVDAVYATEDNPIDDDGGLWGLSFWLGKCGLDWEWLDNRAGYRLLTREGYAKRTDYTSGAMLGWAPYIGDVPSVQIADDGTPHLKGSRVLKNLYPYATTITRTGWLKLTEDEYDTYLDVWADINTYVTQMHAAFVTGQVDIDAEWDNFQAELMDMGLQDVIDVYQAALDRYNK
ncbi:MAG: hypothetical protein IKW00_00965 [Clostridia bacterium]|nr:hypothetical protein [Clostridia bacterium]